MNGPSGPDPRPTPMSFDLIRTPTLKSGSVMRCTTERSPLTRSMLPMSPAFVTTGMPISMPESDPLSMLGGEVVEAREVPRGHLRDHGLARNGEIEGELLTQLADLLLGVGVGEAAGP